MQYEGINLLVLIFCVGEKGQRFVINIVCRGKGQGFVME